MVCRTTQLAAQTRASFESMALGIMAHPAISGAWWFEWIMLAPAMHQHLYATVFMCCWWRYIDLSGLKD